MTWLYTLLFFAMAALADCLSVLWHAARERLHLPQVLILGAILETISWAPVAVAIESDVLSATAIAAVNVLGTLVGASIAILRLKKRKKAANHCTCACPSCGKRRQ